MPDSAHELDQLGLRWLLGRAVGVARLQVAEKLRPRPATAAHEVPGSASAITTTWLTSVLCAATPGAHVESFSIPGGSVGTSTRLVLRVQYDAAGRAADLPTQLFVKLTASFQQRLLFGGAGVLEGETVFYTGLRPRFDMEAPRGYAGVVDHRAWTSVVVIEDIVATKGAEFIEPTRLLTLEQVRDQVANLARMHGAMWGHPALQSLAKTPFDHYRYITAFLDMKKRCEVGMDRAKAVVAPQLYGQQDRLYAATRRAMEISSHDLPHTLLHGDAHVGQSYLTGAGRMGLADWQVTMRGGWAHDYAYFVSTACEPDQRREWDRTLLEFYLEQLTEHGGKPPAFAEAWRQYCQQLFYPYAAWAFTLGRAVYQPKMQPDEFSLAILRRTSAAIAENDAFAAIGL